MTRVIHPLSLGMSEAYLIESDEGLVLLDAGSPGHERKVLRRMSELGRDDLRLIFITHAHLDHYGSAAALRRATGAKIVIHEQDAEAMADGQTILGSARGRGRLLPPFLGLFERFRGPEPTPPDVLLGDGDSLLDLGLNGWLLHTPGHTVGSSCLIVDDEVAFAGDLITNRDRPRLQRYYAQDWNLLQGSLRRLQAANPTLVYPGHGRKPLISSQLQEL